MPTLAEVFGISNSVPKYTYVDRAGLDRKFSYLLLGHKHIVIHGASKQGKTILRKKNLPEHNSITVQCGANATRNQLYSDILRQLNVRIPVEISTNLGFTSNAHGSVSGQLGLPFLASSEVDGGLEMSMNKDSGTKMEPVGIDPTSLGFIADEIKKSNKRIVIEDFHYLSEQEKCNLSFDLKAFWDIGIFFIIIGIWPDQNLLSYYNGDLSGRIEEIDIQWSDQELASVLEKGQKELKIDIDSNIKNEILSDASNNIGLLQRLAEKYCYESGIYDSYADFMLISDFDALDRCRRNICDEESVRYRLFDDVVSRGLRDSGDSELKVYQKITRACVEASDHELRDGITRAEILNRIRRYEPKIRGSDLSAALNNINRLQTERKVSPIILSYNPITRKIQLVDREFLFFRKYRRTTWSWEQTDDTYDE